jgi:hypothetical protein
MQTRRQSTAGEQKTYDTAADQHTVRRALELTRKSRLRPFSLPEMLSRIPDDWQPGEDNVDEFLSSLRGGSDQV